MTREHHPDQSKKFSHNISLYNALALLACIVTHVVISSLSTDIAIPIIILTYTVYFLVNFIWGIIRIPKKDHSGLVFILWAILGPMIGTAASCIGWSVFLKGPL